MLRATFAALALLCVGASVFLYYDIVYALMLPFLVLFTRRAGMRVLSKLLIVPLIYMVMPEPWRHFVDARVRACRTWCKRGIDGTIIVWKTASWPLRVLIACGAAVCAGISVAACIVFPVPVKRIPFVGEALRREAIPYLMHQSALRGIEEKIPDIIKRMPRGLRDFLKKYYMRLWWKTARKLVKTRQGLGRNMLRRKLERENMMADEQLRRHSILEQRILP